MKVFFLFLLLFPQMSLADERCDDLWFSRNVIYDNFGYCFGSSLGKLIFDNEGCTSSDPKLPEALANRVGQIWAKDQSLNCSVDQDQELIIVFNRKTRALVKWQPVIGEREFVCLNYLNSMIELYDGPDTNANSLGQLKQGDNFALFHKSEQPWEFVTILSTANDTEAISGWAKFEDEFSCEVSG